MIWVFKWWLWIAVSIVFAIAETLAPVFVFLGLAAGALIVGILLAVGVEFGGRLALMLTIFASVALVSGIAMRFVFGPHKHEVKTFTNDINS